MHTNITENEKLMTIISALPDLVFILTESGRYADIFGGSDSEFYHDGSGLIGKSLYDVLPKEKADWFLEQIHLTLQHNKLMVVEYSLAGDDVDSIDKQSGPAGSLWFEGRVKPLPSLYNNERAVVWVARNVTNKRHLEMKLRHLSEIDVLTGISNRRKLLEKLDEKFQEFQRYQQPTCFLLLDIDQFKSINDQFGHQAGDAAIKHVTQLCLSQLRNVDLIGRLGGDEFGIILPNTSIDEATACSERLRAAICTTPFHTGKHDIFITISIGLSEFQSVDSVFDEIISRADSAMYQSKQQGKNTSRIYNPSTDTL